MRDLRAFAWSMSQLPGMPPVPPPTQGRRICVSCGRCAFGHLPADGHEGGVRGSGHREASALTGGLERG